MIGCYTKQVALALILALYLTTQVAHGQGRFMVLSGEFVSPAYEGWWPNDDGSYKLFFGYMNSNWEEEFQEEMAIRRANMKDRNDYDVGCPLCWAPETLAVVTSEGDSE